MTNSFSLSQAAVDILLEHCGLGRAPFPFQLPHIGTSRTQRAQVRDAVFRDLDGRGLLRHGRDGRADVDDDLQLALRTLVRPQLAITAAAQLEDSKMLFARAATDGTYAVLAKQDDNLLLFEEARSTGLVPAIVDLLPLTPAAGGQSVTVARPARRKARQGSDQGSYDPFAGVQRPRPQASNQMRTVERIFEKPRKRIGQFTVLVRGQSNREAPLAPIAWFDTDDGRYMGTTRSADDGQDWITYTPADNARIAQQLYSQLEGYL